MIQNLITFVSRNNGGINNSISLNGRKTLIILTRFFNWINGVLSPGFLKN